jgi:hypothetical protein
MTSATAPLRGPLRKRESHLWQRDEHDWYIEPIWCSARLFEAEKFEGGIWDPACGSGRIPQAAIDAGLEAVGTDLIARWQRTKVLNFLQASTGACNIVSNRRDGANDKTRFEHNRSASAPISTLPGIWSSDSSTGSNIAAASQRATTSWRRTTSHWFSLHPYAYDCALMSPRPNPLAQLIISPGSHCFHALSNCVLATASVSALPLVTMPATGGT